MYHLDVTTLPYPTLPYPTLNGWCSLQGEVEMDVHDDRSLLALQGPAAAEVLGPLMDLDLKAFYFSQFAKPDIAGIPCFLTRTGCASP